MKAPEESISLESGRRILIVDDEEPIRLLCERILGTPGCLVETAKSGDEALTSLHRHEFDIVLTDLTMPGYTNGILLLEEVKNRAPMTDVIIMTGYPALETAIPTLKKGAYDYLIKPFDQESLRAVVTRCFEKRSLSAELKQEKKMRQELEAAYAQLSEMEQLKEAFIARVNHELRIPLAPAFMAADLLARSLQDPEHLSLCRMVQSRLQELKEVVESLLLFTEVRKNDFEWMKTEVRIEKMLHQIVDRLRPEWEERHVSIQVNVATEAEVLWADQELLETVFKNMILNAIRFNRSGGRVDISARLKDGAVILSFTDTGIGIPEDKLDKIFDSFYQIASYLTREVGGMGLGLAIVKRIVELLGGRILVQSRYGEGSTFTIKLPQGAVIGAASQPTGDFTVARSLD